MDTKEGNEESKMLGSSYDGRASLSFMRETSSYSATDMTSSMGQIRPYSSQPCSITRGSDLWGSNMMLLGVTISTPPTTPCDNNIRQRHKQAIQTIYKVPAGKIKINKVNILVINLVIHIDHFCQK